MASLISRTSILIVSRVINLSILLLAPIFLVRIFDVQAYGQYREFILYSMFFYHIFLFSINSNLIYFIPHNPKNEDKYVTNTAIFSLASFLFGLMIVFLGKDLILSKTSYDFIFPLIMYLFFSLNMSFWDSYWLGKKRSDFVFYLAVIYMAVRMIAVLATAYYTQNVLLVIYSICAVESLKLIFVFFSFFRKKKFTTKLNLGIMKSQLVFIIPLGFANIIMQCNNHLSQLYVSTILGVEFLALYTIGSYKIPILNVVRSSVVDVIFPEVVEKTKKDPLKGLELWQKSNIIFCVVSFPLFIIFFYYADVFIQTLFTSDYTDSVPIFRIYLSLLIVQAFEMTVPLRGINKTKYFLSGNIIRLIINIILLVILSKFIGLLGPAVAMVVSGYVINIYLARYIMKLYKIKIAGLFMWGKVFKIAGSAIIGLPIFFLADLIDMNDILRAVLFSIIYLTIFLSTVYLTKIEEFIMLANQLHQRTKKVLM